MHQLISSEQSAADRFVTLKNLKTDTLDYCFDRSEFPNDIHPGFYFMKQGGIYNCKILLFGDTDIRKGFPVADCCVVNPNVMLANCRMVEVAVGADIYYIYYDRVREVVNNGRFQFQWTRKDLIQVNDVLLSDFYIYDFWKNE